MVNLELITTKKVIAPPPQAELMRVLGMIYFFPKNATFITQNEGEKIVMVIRRHIVQNVSWLFNAALLFLLPTIVMLLIRFADATFAQNSILQSELVLSMDPRIPFVLGSFYYSFCVTFVIFNYIIWYYDAFIVTNERYISVDFDVVHGVRITDIPLQDIVDITENVLGVWANLFGYGSIEFKTLSQKLCVIPNIPYPTWFRDSFADLIKFIRANEHAHANAPRHGNLETAPAENNESLLATALEEVKPNHKVDTRHQISNNLEP